MGKYIFSIILGIISLMPSNKDQITSNITPPAETNKLSYKYFTVDNEKDHLELYGNWSEKKSLKQLAAEKQCQSAINAGFYDTEGMPLGLFINSELKKTRPKTSNLINGYIYYSGNTINVSSILPENTVWATQVGPILKDNLQLVKDEPARRTVAIKTKEKIIFLIIYNEDSRLDGPYLKDLNSEILAISKIENWTIETAINLDGGSASGFVDGDVYIPELTFVGSFFCKKRLS